MTEATLRRCMNDKSWRMNHLYTIVDESGNKVPFRQRAAILPFASDPHPLKIILKARQLGYSSETDMEMLDDCIFSPNLVCGIVAHTLIDAQEIFRTKVQLPYNELPEFVRKGNKAIQNKNGMLKLANGSSIRVAVGFRSSTTHRLHISELGKICAKYPVRAQEIMTGTLPSVHSQLGCKAVIEGTAEGPAGFFYETCIQAQSDTANALKENRPLSPLHWKFFFSAWFEDPKNAIDPLGITISDETNEYFAELAEKGILTATPNQQAWYAQTKDGAGGLGKLMKQEHPSTVAEAFEASVTGAVFGDEMIECRAAGNIGFFPWVKDVPVHTFWDLGYHHSNCVGYVQFIRGELRVIDYSCERGRGAPYHAEQVESKPYVYAEHHMPHDVMNHEKGTGIVLKDVYSSLLKAPIRTVKRPKLKIDSITALCDIFNMIRFNARTCCVEVKDQPEKNLVKAAAYYRYQWDEDSKTYSKDPVDDWAADPADMLQTLAMEYRYGKISGERIGSPIPVAANLRSNADPYGGWHVLDGVRKRRS